MCPSGYLYDGPSLSMPHCASMCSFKCPERDYCMPCGC
jgi:hypothetical protein